MIIANKFIKLLFFLITLRLHVLLFTVIECRLQYSSSFFLRVIEIHYFFTLWRAIKYRFNLYNFDYTFATLP